MYNEEEELQKNCHITASERLENVAPSAVSGVCVGWWSYTHCPSNT